MAPASSSNATCSTTVCSTPSSRAHTLLNRTPFHPLGTQPLDSREPSGGTACSHGRQLKSPTDQSQEPKKGASLRRRRLIAATGTADTHWQLPALGRWVVRSHWVSQPR